MFCNLRYKHHSSSPLSYNIYELWRVKSSIFFPWRHPFKLLLVLHHSKAGRKVSFPLFHNELRYTYYWLVALTDKGQGQRKKYYPSHTDSKTKFVFLFYQTTSWHHQDLTSWCWSKHVSNNLYIYNFYVVVRNFQLVFGTTKSQNGLCHVLNVYLLYLLDTIDKLHYSKGIYFSGTLLWVLQSGESLMFLHGTPTTECFLVRKCFN